MGKNLFLNYNNHYDSKHFILKRKHIQRTGQHNYLRSDKGQELKKALVIAKKDSEKKES